LFAHRLFQGSDFAEHFNQQSLKRWTIQIGEVGWQRHIHKESHRVEPGQGKNAGRPTFLPLLRCRRKVRLAVYENLSMISMSFVPSIGAFGQFVIGEGWTAREK